jgi:hypothetical protein
MFSNLYELCLINYGNHLENVVNFTSVQLLLGMTLVFDQSQWRNCHLGVLFPKMHGMGKWLFPPSNSAANLNYNVTDG